MNLLERREFLKGLFFISLHPKGLFEAIIQEADTFPWTREEILFGPDAGFEQARAQIPLAVYLSPGILPDIIETGTGAWNDLAQRIGRGDLFRIENDQSKAQKSIRVVPY